MDHSRLPILRGDVRGLPAARSTSANASGFVPLKLVLQPNGLAVELTRPNMLLGRHSTADLRLPLPDVSRRHCRFLFQDGVWQVVDLDSMNGIYVNGMRVLEATLHDQDLLRIGGFQFKVLIQAEARAGAPAAEQAAGDSEMIQQIAKPLPAAPRRGETPRRRAS
jgi:predicted component of type VI protein secretion system